MIEPIKTEKPEQIIYAPVIKPKKNINAFVNGGTYLYRRIHILGNVGDLFCYALF